MLALSKSLVTCALSRVPIILCKYSTEAPIRSLLNSSEKAAKAAVACKCKRMIKYAAREKGPFPEYNPTLAYWMEEAKKCGVPQKAIDFSLKLTLEHKAKMGHHEIALPGKGLLVTQFETVDTSYLQFKIMKICEEFEMTYMLNASYSHIYYNSEAVIVVSGRAGDKALDDSDKEKLSSFRNAQINEELDHNGEKSIVLRCEASNLHRVRNNLINMGYIVQEAFVGLIPKSLIKLPSKTVEKVADLLLALGEMKEVERLYDNVE